jgi:hypothetical protein
MRGTEAISVCSELMGNCRIASAVNILEAFSSSPVYLEKSANVARVTRVIPRVDTLAGRSEH